MTDTITRRWIIVQEPGRVPEAKIPTPNDHDGVVSMLRELKECRPSGTECTVAELTWNNDLWVHHGGEYLEIADAAIECADDPDDEPFEGDGDYNNSRHGDEDD